MFSYQKLFEKEYEIMITVNKDDKLLVTDIPIDLAKSNLKDTEHIFIFNEDITCSQCLNSIKSIEKKGK